jgi:RNA polymerase sigma factor (sigma-70 family)
VDEDDWLAERFEADRNHLRPVAYRMLGSLDEADDAVQEAWLRLSRADAGGIENLRAWLTTVVARVCLSMLRSRESRREVALDLHVPEPIVSPEDGVDPEQEALLADSVGLALLVVLERLAPAERLAFVLHDMFAIPFDEIALIVGRSPAAARKLARRGGAGYEGPPRRLTPISPASAKRSTPSSPPAAAATSTRCSRCSTQTSCSASTAVPCPLGARGWSGGRGPWPDRRSPLARRARFTQPALVNGAAGIVVFAGRRPFSVMGFTVAGGKIVEIDVLADPARLGRLDLAVLGA